MPDGSLNPNLLFTEQACLHLHFQAIKIGAIGGIRTHRG
jgi:hypothetical protein